MSLTDLEKKVLIAETTGNYSVEEIRDIDLGDYHVLTDTEADDMNLEQVRESIWAFNADFLAGFLGCPVEAVQAVQNNDKCEDNNEVFINWLSETNNTIEEFAEEAASVDGRGHFLSPYNGEELEVDFDGTDYYIYKLN